MSKAGTFLISLAAAALIAGPACAANLIHNGSFESPVLATGGFQAYAPGSAVGGWTVIGATGTVGLVNGEYQFGGITFPAAQGNQWLDLTGDTNTVTGIQQTVATTPGVAYTLSFYVGNVNDPSGYFGTTSTVVVRVNGKRIYTASNTLGAAQNKIVWRKFSTTITADSAHTTITFVNGDSSADASNGIDVVTLVPIPAGEPAYESDAGQ